MISGNCFVKHLIFGNKFGKAQQRTHDHDVSKHIDHLQFLFTGQVCCHHVGADFITQGSLKGILPTVIQLHQTGIERLASEQFQMLFGNSFFKKTGSRAEEDWNDRNGEFVHEL